MTRQWFTVATLAKLAPDGLPKTPVATRDFAERNGWKSGEEGVRWRTRQGRGGGVEFHVSVLPLCTQAALALAAQAVPSTDDKRASRRAAKRAIERDGLWSWFEALPQAKRDAAQERLRALQAWETLTATKGKVAAQVLIAAQIHVAPSTLYAWEELVLGLDRADWLPALAPRHAGGQKRADCADEAWDMLRADYLRPERPTFEACFRRLEDVAAQRAWTLPSARTLRRRIEALPASVVMLAREGAERLKAAYPAQERTRGHFHALEAVNVDGHKWDVFVRWPDGVVGRPLMVAFQDLYSGKLLAWRCDKTENKEATRLAFGDLVEEFGIPDHCWLDNGRAFASKWITGGSPNRYRFKVKDDEPLGLMTALGVKTHWTNPYAGQSKPIERMFRDFATDAAKHPAFAGAYTGNNPLAKPENYQSKAVPLDLFLKTIAAATAEHNARVGRRTAVCNGRSFDQAFADSYAAAPIKRATGAQRRLWLLAAEAIGTSRRDGSISLEGNRFWSPFLSDHLGTRVSVRFDPAALQDDLHVYALDGRYLGAAKCIEAVGFDDVAKAQEHARARKSWLKAQRAMLDAERRMTIAQVADLLPDTGPATPPERKVVRLVTGNTALAAREIALPEQDPREAKLIAGMAKLRLVNREG